MILPIKGFVQLHVRNPDGDVVRRGRNLVTALGKANIATFLMSDVNPAFPSHFAFGDGNDPVDEQNTALENEHTRLAYTMDSRILNIVGYNLANWTNVGAPLTISEMGLFNAGVGGDLYARWLPQLFVIDTNGILNLTWTLTIGGA